MGTPVITFDQDRVVHFGHALAHPLRVELLTAYGTQSPACPSQLAASAPAFQEAGLGLVNYHTLQLVEHGALECVKEDTVRGGARRHYKLSAAGVEMLKVAEVIGRPRNGGAQT